MIWTSQCPLGRAWAQPHSAKQVPNSRILLPELSVVWGKVSGDTDGIILNAPPTSIYPSYSYLRVRHDVAPKEGSVCLVPGSSVHIPRCWVGGEQTEGLALGESFNGKLS